MAAKPTDIARKRGGPVGPPQRWGKRLKVQLLGLLAFNGYFWAPWGKYACLPVLNCYACPASTTACPLGSIKEFAASRRFPYYVLGSLGVAGVAMGRAFCGWACPFGWLQDMLYRIRTRKVRLPRAANWLKYVLLVSLVIALPAIDGKPEEQVAADTVVKEGTGARNFCSLVCPAGTLEASVPSLLYSQPLREAATWRTYSKIGLLVGFLALMVFSRRSFCRGACPLGALMALATPISALRLRTDPDKCTRCMRCVHVCPTDCRHVPSAEAGKEATAECVLCLDCVRACPEQGALSAWLGNRMISISQGKGNA
jgi:polyferredoxin